MRNVRMTPVGKPISKTPVGGELLVTEREARILELRGRARRVVASKAMQAEEPIAPVKSKRAYKRRDMVAES